MASLCLQNDHRLQTSGLVHAVANDLSKQLGIKVGTGAACDNMYNQSSAVMCFPASANPAALAGTELTRNIISGYSGKLVEPGADAWDSGDVERAAEYAYRGIEPTAMAPAFPERKFTTTVGGEKYTCLVATGM